MIPRLQILDIQIKNLVSDRIDLLTRIQIDNHFPLAFKVDSMKYKIFISNKEVAKSSYCKSIIIQPGYDNLIELPISVFNKRLNKILKNAEQKGIDSMEYELKTTFYIHSVFKKKFDLDVKKLLPLIYIPEVTVDKIEIDSLRLSGVTLMVHSTLINKNVFPLDAINLHDRFTVGGNPWVDARVPGLMKIPPHSKTESILPFKISFKEMAHTLPELIKKGKNIDYKLETSFKINSKDNTTNNSLIKLESKGTIKDLLRYYRAMK